MNATRLQALDVPSIDHHGREVVIAVVKATFHVDRDGRCRPADEPAVIRTNDVLYRDDDPRSSARYPSDIAAEKVGTDIVVIGDALSPRPVPTMDVAVKIRDVTVPLRVHGERRYFRNVMEIAISVPAPFERQPIVYEKAYGGTSDDHSVVELRNPSGVGVAKRDADLIDRAAPQVEHPAYPHRSPRDRHPPVGCGALLPQWSPRREYAGTFDESWKTSRMPLMPRDFDVRHNSVAHPLLWLPEALRPGDAVGVLGMTLDGFLGFAVPPLGVMIRGRFDEVGVIEARPPIDTLLLEPERRRVEVTMRHAFPLGRGKRVLREVVVDANG